MSIARWPPSQEVLRPSVLVGDVIRDEINLRPFPRRPVLAETSHQPPFGCVFSFINIYTVLKAMWNPPGLIGVQRLNSELTRQVEQDASIQVSLTSKYLVHPNLPIELYSLRSFIDLRSIRWPIPSIKYSSTLFFRKIGNPLKTSPFFYL
jgi:hypothetical protein